MVDMIRPDFPGSQAVTQSFLHAAHIATRVDFLANPLIARTARSCWAKTRKSLGSPLHPMESHGIAASFCLVALLCQKTNFAPERPELNMHHLISLAFIFHFLWL